MAYQWLVSSLGSRLAQWIALEAAPPTKNLRLETIGPWGWAQSATDGIAGILLPTLSLAVEEPLARTYNLFCPSFLYLSDSPCWFLKFSYPLKTSLLKTHYFALSVGIHVLNPSIWEAKAGVELKVQAWSTHLVPGHPGLQFPYVLSVIQDTSIQPSGIFPHKFSIRSFSLIT